MAAKDDSLQGSRKVVRPGEPIDLSTSVAGEEDPGASIDLAQARGNEAAKPAPAAQSPMETAAQANGMAPGDQAPPGTPSTGENVCPQCGGSGRVGASSCPNCLGTGKVTVGIGGA